MRLAAFSMAWCLMLASCGDEADPTEPEPTEPPRTGGGEDAPEPGGDRVSVDGMCGGIAGFNCPEGEWCDLEGNYPDASGTCRPEGTCDEPADCVQQDLTHAMCVGDWQCQEARCAWQCETA